MARIIKLSVLAVLAMGATVASVVGAESEEGEAAHSGHTVPIQVSVKSRPVGKIHSCDFALHLLNTHDFPVWYVMPWSANELLRHDGRFRSEYEGGEIPFGAIEYLEDEGRAVVVRHHGKDGFYAILVPAKGRFRFDRFVVFSGGPVRFIDVWEVRSLRVNGKTPLEQWLPYNVESSKNTHITAGRNSIRQISLEWFHARTANAKPYPDEKVVGVTAEGVKRYVVPLPE